MARKLPYDFRFGDLSPGQRFFVDGDFQYQYLTVASCRNGGNCWEGNRKRYLNDNVKVIVHDDDRKAVILSRLKSIRQACKKHNITPRQLRGEYRLAVAKSNPHYPATRIAATRELSPPAYNAIQDLGLMVYHNGEYLIAGDHRRYFL